MKPHLDLHIPMPEGLTLTEHDAAMIIAGKLFTDGTLSAGEAAKFAGITKRVFIETIGQYGYSVFSQSTEDLKQDIQNA